MTALGGRSRARARGTTLTAATIKLRRPNAYFRARDLARYTRTLSRSLRPRLITVKQLNAKVSVIIATTVMTTVTSVENRCYVYYHYNSQIIKWRATTRRPAAACPRTSRQDSRRVSRDGPPRESHAPEHLSRRSILSRERSSSRDHARVQVRPFDFPLFARFRFSRLNFAPRLSPIASFVRRDNERIDLPANLRKC